ncbi:Electron transfer flavoprotein alpha-subunit [Cryptotrichosporon argae]
MLLTELIMAKRGPLAKVWLSAFHERKLSKQQALGIDVKESVDAILEEEGEPLALRVSGQLMLGVVRIYSRKVQYLMDDCKETRERISMAFRPGMVDLPEDQVRASRAAITFSETQNILDWTLAVPAAIDYRGLQTAPPSQTNLPVSREYGAFNFGRPKASSIYGSTPSRHGSHDENGSHLDSNDFSGVDLGLELEVAPERRSVEAPEAGRERVLRSPSAFGQKSQTTPFEEFQPEGVDLGIDLGFDFGVQDEPVPGLNRSRRATSALTDLPPTSPDGALLVAPRAPTVKRRLIRADAELELPDEEFAAPGPDSVLLSEVQYIPADPDYVRLRSIIADPTAHFLPTIKQDANTLIFAGPQGLAPELAELFTFPVNILRRDGEPSPKRQRTEDVEAGRRGSIFPEQAEFEPFHEGDFGGGEFEPYAGGKSVEPTDIGLIPEIEDVQRTREQSLASVAIPDRGEYPLLVFDSRHRDARGEFDSNLSESAQTALSKFTYEAPHVAQSSRNTALAAGVLRRELEGEGETEAAESVEFGQVAQKASKRAASAFFFELLVLGTRDCVKLEQPEAYGEITVVPKPKLFELVA